MHDVAEPPLKMAVGMGSSVSVALDDSVMISITSSTLAGANVSMRTEQVLRRESRF